MPWLDGSTARNVVLFEWLPGSEPDPEGDAVLDGFRALGAVSARMHAHARAWQPPAGLRPPRRGTTSTRSARPGTGAAGRTGSAWAPEELRAARPARRDDRARGSSAYGQAPERFGLVHADIRLANLLVDGGHVRVIDFDDCGLHLVHVRLRDHGLVHGGPPARARAAGDAWLEGYRSVAPLDAADEAELATFVMLRRLLLVAWIGSHHTFATEAAELGAGFTAGTCALAERYLSTHCLGEPDVFTPLTGRTVLVTGGTKGIGKGIAGVFARAGANVAIAGRDERARRGGGATELGGALTLIADVAKRRGLRAHGRRDGRAVRRPRRPVRERRHLPRRQARRHDARQDIDAIFAINVKGTMLSVQGRAARARGAAATAA